jgi:tetratricopeptide (TPR) repeat protein
MLWVTSLAIAPHCLGAQETGKTSSLAGWLETNLDQDSPYVLEIKDVDAEKLILIANTLCEKKEYRQAIKIYQKVLEEFNSADAAYNLGLTYEINIKNPSLALLYYSKFLSLEPNSPDAEAVQTWIEHIKKKKKSPSKQMEEEKEEKAAEILPGLRSSEEKKTIKWAIRSGPPINEEDISYNRLKTAQSYLRKGNEYYIKEHYREAIEDFIEVLKYYDSTDAYYNIGIIYHQKLNDPASAIPFYRRYLEVDAYTETANEIKKFLEQAETSILMKKLQKKSIETPAQ